MPDLNPVGLPSIVTTVVALLLASLTTGLIPLSPDTRRKWTIAAPILLMASCLLSIAMPHDADDFAGGIICLVAGFFFAIQNLPYASVPCRVTAILFGLLYGAATVLLAVDYTSGDLLQAVAGATLFIVVWFLVVALFHVDPRAKRPTHRTAAGQPRADRFQFTLRGLLTGILVVAVILGLCRAMIESLKRDRLSTHDLRLQHTLIYVNDRLTLISLPNVGASASTGDQILAGWGNASPERRSVIGYLQSTGLDFADMDADEVVVFWLAVKSLWKTLSLQAGGNVGLGNRPDWAALLEDGGFYGHSSDLVDRDGDDWPEYIFRSRADEYPDKVLRLKEGRIVAWDVTADRATGIRKGYALDQQGELQSFVIADSPP